MGSQDGEKSTWPNEQVYLFKDVLQSDALQSVQQHSEACSKLPNIWITKETVQSDPVEHPQNVGELVENAARQAYQSVFVSNNIPLSDKWQGVEWWLQVYQQGRGLDFHFDKDEALFKGSQLMQHPQWSLVIYLTGDEPVNTKNAQAPTVVLNQTFDQNTKQPVPDTPEYAIIVPPIRNRAVLLNGRLGHGVFSSPPTAVRATIIFNWWEYKPLGIMQCKDMESIVALSNLPEKGSQLSQRILSNNQAAENSGTTSGECACQNRLAIRQISIADNQEELLVLDDIISSFPKPFGSQEYAGVSVHHPGRTIVPLAFSEEQETNDENVQHVQLQMQDITISEEHGEREADAVQQKTENLDEGQSEPKQGHPGISEQNKQLEEQENDDSQQLMYWAGLVLCSAFEDSDSS